MLKLNDFFSNNINMEKVLFVNDNKEYTKLEISNLIKKHIEIALQMKGEDCILHTNNNILFIVGFFALLHAKKNIILASNTRPATLEMLGVKNILPLSFDTDDIKDIKIEPFDETDAKIFFFTSGSTGTPKRILKTFNSLYQELYSVEAKFEKAVKKDTSILMTVSMGHLYGITFAFLYPMVKGFLTDTKLIETPEELEYRLSLHKHSLLVSSPAFMDRLAKYKNEYNFPHKPYLMISSGGPLSKEGAIASQDLFGIYPNEVFGSTETGVVGTRQQIIDEHWSLFPYVTAHKGEDGNLVVTSGFMDDDVFLMGDSVDFIDSEKFILKGRMDRMIKLEEKRVSLPELEKNLENSEFISKAYCLEIYNKNERKEIGACISLSQSGRVFLIEEGRKKLLENLKYHLEKFIDKTAIPSKWRFVDEVPVNSQSKILIEKIRDMFSSNISEPVALNKKVKNNIAEYELVFLEDASYFKGHFPDFALLPAVAQIHIAMHFAKLNWNVSFNIKKMTKIKFSNIIKPKMKIMLDLKLEEESISFKYHYGENTYSSGSLFF